MSPASAIRRKEQDAILQSLRAGVVPRTGLQHIQVGRIEEVKALLKDIECVADGGSAIRFVIGEYGSGKTFFLFLVRLMALEKRVVTVHADLSPDRRLYSTSGEARSLYAELMRNLATRTKPDGGALPAVVERFITSAQEEATSRSTTPDSVIKERLASLSELVGGYDFAEVVAAYWRGHDTGDEVLKSNAIRWLRGEFTTRTDARKALGVREIVEDDNVYDHLKLFAKFTRLAGYAGLLVCLDELVNLYKLSNTKARNTNYEQILRIVNDSLQGSAEGIGFLFGGTPDFLLNPRKGLYGYEALRSRLAQNRFAVDGRVDYSGPILNLANLTPEEVFVLLRNVQHVHAAGDPSSYLLPDEGLGAFMQHCSKQVGDAYFRTPRNTIIAFVSLLAVLEQNRSVDWRELIGEVEVGRDAGPDLAPILDQESPAGNVSENITPSQRPDDELTSFKL
jgi:hypothetical protein